MMGRSHMALGATLSTITMLAVGPNPLEKPAVLITGVVVGTVASLLPDIDGDPDSPADPLVRTLFGVGNTQTKRQVWRTLLKGDILGFLWALVRRVVAMIINIFANILPHRGVTHWGMFAICLYFLALILCLVTGVPTSIALAFFVGYMSHIMADMMTKSGVALFAPFGPRHRGKPRRYHLLPKHLRFTTGSVTEKIVVALVVLASTPLIWVLYIIR